jgi:S-DNA-T family DNA segregation ATPase FtsK/SpoIIIE
MTAAESELPPLLAEWMRSWGAFRGTVGGALRRSGHRVSWHLVRLPLYAGRLALMSPWGLARLWGQAWQILTDGQGHDLRVTAATSGEADTWLKLRKERNERIHRRLVVAGVVAAPVVLVVLAFLSPAVLGVIAGLALAPLLIRAASGLPGLGMAVAAPFALWWVAPRVIPPLPLPPWWAVALAGFVIIEGLGWVGRPIGQPIIRPAVPLADHPDPVTAPFVIEALTRLGIGGMGAQHVDQIRLLMDVARTPTGWQLDLELPPGVPASAVVDRRDKLSAAMRRELGCVWPTRGARHEGHLALFVSEQPLVRQKQREWPLLRDGVVDVFRPFPAFTNSQGRWVDVTLAYTSWVIGAVPRMGKTFALRQLLLAAGLDARTKVYAIDGKGTGDLAPCALYAHFYSVGDEEEELLRILTTVRGLREEMRRRARVIRELPREECPESKVTSALASRRELRLEPIVIGVDETQVYFEDAPKKLREELVSIFTDLAKRGPALGIVPLMATQNVTAQTIPTPISNNAVVRFCMKVFGYQAVDQILGTGAYKSGLDAQMFSNEDKGIGYLRADGAVAQIVRTVHGLDAVAAERVALRARLLRQESDRLTGDAAGDTMAEEERQVVLLDDVRQVFGAAAAMHIPDLVAALAELRPALYGHLDVFSLGRLLRAAGVEVDTVYDGSKPRDEASRKGVKREWLDVAATDVLGVLPEDEEGEPREG